MPSKDTGSVTHWVDQLKAGDYAAAQPLWERYYQRLVRLARSRLPATPPPAPTPTRRMPHSSALNSFCICAASGRFPQIADRDGLWGMLMLITVRKAADQVKRWEAEKAGRAAGRRGRPHRRPRRPCRA